MIPFLDLKAQYRSIKAEIDAAVLSVLESGQYVLGPEVAAFEEEFAKYCGTKHAVAVNSGTSALHLALLARGIGPGDEVITVPMTFVATVAAVRYTGARPAFVDIDPASYTMDPSKVEAAVTPRTKAVMPVHLYGQTADMDPIIDIARRRGISVIEDAAQAHGAEYKGRRAGSLGDIGCFSFYPGKNLGACGEGGIVVTNDPEIDLAVRMLRDWGQDRKYHHLLPGYNYRMEGMQGAVLRVKLRHLDAWTEARRACAARYDALLAGAGVRPPKAMPWGKHVYHVYAIGARRRDDLGKALTAAGIQWGLHYPTPVHMQPAYADMGVRRGDFPVSERWAEEEISLPIFSEIKPEEQTSVAQVIAQHMKA